MAGRRAVRAAATALVAVTVTMGGAVVAASPASAQSGSRICGAFSKAPTGQVVAWAAEVPKQSVDRWRGVCSYVQGLADNNFAETGYLSYMTCEDFGRLLNGAYGYDPCLAMNRWDTLLSDNSLHDFYSPGPG